MGSRIAERLLLVSVHSRTTNLTGQCRGFDCRRRDSGNRSMAFDMGLAGAIPVPRNLLVVMHFYPAIHVSRSLFGSNFADQ